MSIDDYRKDISSKQKKGIHFIIGSIIIWVSVLIVQILNIPILTKNLLTFCCTTSLLPLAYIVSRTLNIDFTTKANPLTKLGILFSLNQMLYILIAMWIYPTIPDKMLMVLTVIFGAHLLPYSWLYHSVSYGLFSLIIAIGSMVLGLLTNSLVLASSMVIIEILFCLFLSIEIKNDNY